MNKLLTSTLLIGALSLSSLSAIAQTKKIELKPTMLQNEKGNGGEYSAINHFGIKADFFRVRGELIQFLSSDTAISLFPKIDLGQTLELLKNNQTFEFTQRVLIDKFYLKRDALNFPNNLKIFLEKKNLEEAMGTKAVYILVLHEVFGLQNIETNNIKSSDFAYEKSLKIWKYIHTEKVFKLKSFKAIAPIESETICTKRSGVNINVCADIIKKGESIIIKNISPNIESKRSLSRNLCRTFGDSFNKYKIKVITKRACNYYSTKGFYSGENVSSCLDLGGLFRGHVFDEIRCISK